MLQAKAIVKKITMKIRVQWLVKGVRVAFEGFSILAREVACVVVSTWKTSKNDANSPPQPPWLNRKCM
jgi:hypothetical protein